MFITIEQIQKKIAEAIKQSGISQTELAEKIGIKQPQVSCYVHEKKIPSLDTFANLCAILDVDPSDILCINEYKKENN